MLSSPNISKCDLSMLDQLGDVKTYLAGPTGPCPVLGSNGFRWADGTQQMSTVCDCCAAMCHNNYRSVTANSPKDILRGFEHFAQTLPTTPFSVTCEQTQSCKNPAVFAVYAALAPA